jgi:hypothetical protein
MGVFLVSSLYLDKSVTKLPSKLLFSRDRVCIGKSRASHNNVGASMLVIAI